MSDTYPTDRKKSQFAIRYVKALFASDAISLHGADVVAFACWIVSLEDKLHYSKPIALWRADVKSKFNIHRNESHSKLIKAAEESGLVHQVDRPKGSRDEMKFWATVPDWLLPYFRNSTGSENGTSQPSTGSENGTSERTTGSENGTRNGTSGGTSGGTLPIPYTQNPSLGDTNKRRFVPPSVSDVAQYASEIGSGIDPERFIDYYAANGWNVGKSAMKDWKACFRNWNRTDKPSSEHRPELQPMEVLR